MKKIFKAAVAAGVMLLAASFGVVGQTKPKANPNQTAKAVLSKEEADKVEALRRVLEAVAQTGIGQDSVTLASKVTFTGDMLIEETQLGSRIYRTQYSNINWAEYESFDYAERTMDGDQMIFKFTSDTIQRGSFRVLDDGSMDAMPNAFNTNMLTIVVHPSQRKHRKALEEVANTLAQMSKEKGNLFPTKPK